MCEQERADQGCLMSEWIALGGSVPGGGSRGVLSPTKTQMPTAHLDVGAYRRL